MPVQNGVAVPRLLTGDFLFLGTCGWTDLESGSSEQMFASLQRLKTLPPETIVHPGHHYSPPTEATLAHELQHNEALLCQTLDQLQNLP